MANNQNELWGPIDADQWQDTHHIAARIATTTDVESGNAVFYIADSHYLKPIDIELPMCAIHVDQETAKRTKVVVIQVEESQSRRIVGYRFFEGGNGVGLFLEFEFPKQPGECPQE